jgi:hypothetical protein
VPLIVLWDIDHTLIENAGVSKEIYAAAFAALTGTLPICEAATEGRTDRLIMRDMFRHHHCPEPPWPTIETALGQAGEGHAGDLRHRGTVLPGIREALTVASEEPDWVSTVLTGNIAANARLKLSVFHLDRLLDLPVAPTALTPNSAPILLLLLAAEFIAPGAWLMTSRLSSSGTRRGTSKQPSRLGQRSSPCLPASTARRN